MSIVTKRISFDTILNVWENELWPDRQSPIETHSAMTWPFEGTPDEYDMSIFDYKPYFHGSYVDDKLVGVNSGHQTSNKHFRSRGIWVHPDYRRMRVAQNLFYATQFEARLKGCNMLWSIPRKTALSAYLAFGYMTVGDFIKTETSDANIYVMKTI